MGQYYLIVNEDKKEYLDPRSFDDGKKLTEFGFSGFGTMTALAALLAESNDKGNGGDIPSDSELIGRWCGDKIVIAGDYSEQVKITKMGSEPKTLNLYDAVNWEEIVYKDIGLDIKEVLMDSDEAFRKAHKK